MKNYRLLVPIVLALVLVLSWYMLIDNANSEDDAYNQYLRAARFYAKDGELYAIENYQNALNIRESPELYQEIANYYLQQNKKKEYLNWAKEYASEYPNDPTAYEMLLDAQMLQKDYEECFNILETVAKRKINSDKIDEIREQLKWTFELGYDRFEAVGTYSNNFCPVMQKNLWGFVDRYGKLRIAFNYAKVGAYTQSAFAPVVNQKGEAYFINKSGSKVMTPGDEYVSLGPVVGGVFAAERKDGKYVYLIQNENFDISDERPERFFVCAEVFDFAGTFNGAFAAAQKDGKWSVIGTDFTAVLGDYADVKMDEKLIAYRNDRMFVAKQEGKYAMVDSKGTRIGTDYYDDAFVFLGDEPTAVSINGKWRFIDKDGNYLSERTYDGARPFNNGIAAVCIDGLWGFVDENETVVIEPKYKDAKDFNAKGSCFVLIGDYWQLLKLYRLNREE